MSKIYLSTQAYIGKYQTTLFPIDKAMQSGIDPATAAADNLKNIPSNVTLILGSYSTMQPPEGTGVPIYTGDIFVLTKGDKIYTTCPASVRVKNSSTSASFIRHTWNETQIELVGMTFNGSSASNKGRPFSAGTTPGALTYITLWFFA